MSTLFSRDQILSLLDALGTELELGGHRGDLFLVGGAAMALAYDTRRATRDLDLLRRGDGAFEAIRDDLREIATTPVPWMQSASTASASTSKRSAARTSTPARAPSCPRGAARRA